MHETGTKASQGLQKEWPQGRFHSPCMRKRLTSTPPRRGRTGRPEMKFNLTQVSMLESNTRTHS